MATIDILECWFSFLTQYVGKIEYVEIMAVYDRGAAAIKSDPEHWATRSLRDLMHEHTASVSAPYSPARVVRA
jgi:hypothetical protein